MIDKRLDIIRQLTVKNANDFFSWWALLTSNADRMTGVVETPMSNQSS